MIDHIKNEHMPIRRIFRCPLHCSNQVFTKKELEAHLRVDCGNFELECTDCKGIQKRKYYKPHKPDECIKQLSYGIDELEA